MSQAASELILQMAFGHLISRVVHAGVFLGLPDHLENGPKSAEDIAKEINAHPDSVYRLMRAMSSQGIMVEGDNHIFSKNEASTLLTSTEKGFMRSVILAECGDVHYRGFMSLVKTIQTGEFKGPSDNGVESYWDLHKLHPDLDLEFSKNMSARSFVQTPILVKSSNFQDAKTVCDLGGSQGVLIREILKQNPHVTKGINYDMEHLVALNKNSVREGEEMSRFSEVSGDFFESVPVADVYTMKYIFHDWNDEKCQKILANIQKANPKARVYVYDFVIDTKNKPSFGALFDIKMFHFLDGRERSVEDWTKLLSPTNYSIRTINSQIQPGLLEFVPKQLE